MLDPDDLRELKAQVAADSKYYLPPQWKAEDVKVKIRNNIFPRPDETYNCTNCHNGKEMQRIFWCAPPLHPDEKHYRCKADGCEHVFLPFQDISPECGNSFKPINVRLHRGYQPGVDI